MYNNHVVRIYQSIILTHLDNMKLESIVEAGSQLLLAGDHKPDASCQKTDIRCQVSGAMCQEQAKVIP